MAHSLKKITACSADKEKYELEAEAYAVYPSHNWPLCIALRNMYRCP